MAQENRELVVLMTRGADHELSSVGFTIACGGLTAGMKVCAFLTSSAVDLVRRRAADLPHVPPLDPLKALIDDFMKRGGTVVACPPCVKARGYTQEDFIDGVTIAGASVIHDKLKAGEPELLTFDGAHRAAFASLRHSFKKDGSRRRSRASSSAVSR